MTEAEFITPADQKRHPFYNEYGFPWDLPFSCLTNLERNEDMLVGLAVLRSKKQGHIEAQERSHFTALAGHVRTAVRMQQTLEGQGAALLTGTMEALSLAAFICDSSGRVKAMSPDAEALVQEARGLQLRRGQLCARCRSENDALINAIRRAAQCPVTPSQAALQTLVIRNGRWSGQALVVDVITLPSRPFEFSFVPRALVVVRGARRSDERSATLLQMIYGVTAAEANIALRLAKGESPEAIAYSRNVTIGTVRAQIKTILGKFGVNRQIELVACIRNI